MANYVFTRYAIEGKKEVLEKIAEVINSGDGYTLTAIETLGLSTEDLWDGIKRAEWEKGARVEERAGKHVLFFTQAYPWAQEDVIDWVLREMGDEEAEIYYVMDLVEENIHETNDREGKYFPERYTVYVDGAEDEAYFVTYEEALDYVRSQLKLSDDYNTIEDIEEYCEDNELGFLISEIEVN